MKKAQEAYQIARTMQLSYIFQSIENLANKGHTRYAYEAKVFDEVRRELDTRGYKTTQHDKHLLITWSEE